MAAAVPLRGQSAHQPQVGLVDQGGGLQSLAGLLLGQPLGRQLAQLVVDQRQELLRGLGSPCSMADRIWVTPCISRQFTRRDISGQTR